MARKAKQLPSGSWRIQVPISKEWDTERKKWKYTMASLTAPTKAEVELLAAEWELNHESANKRTANPVLKEAVTAYIERNQGILADTTLNTYRITRDFGFPDLMNTRIRSITDDMMAIAIQKEYKRLNQQTHKPISPKTVKNEYGVISTVLKEYKIQFDVKLKPWKAAVHELSMPEELFKAFKGSDIELPVLLAMWLSFTMSEIRGLTKSGSIKGDMLYIDKVVVYVKGEDISKPVAKNTTRNRGIIIPPYIKGLIDQVEGDVLVPMRPYMIYKRFVKGLQKAGLPEMTFHDLRHVSASTMEMLGVPDKYKQERGGWKTDSTMRSTYIQSFNPVRRSYDQLIDNYFEGFIDES